jgi:hypothetical protein
MASRTLRGTDTVMKALEAIGKKMGSGTMRVGFLEGATYPNGTPVAEVAFYNEFGTINMPPRPFFRNMISEESPNWPKKMAGALAAGYDGPEALGLMGEDIKGALQQSITTLASPALAPSTVHAKGFDKPLIDTGHMLNSVSYEVTP